MHSAHPQENGEQREILPVAERNIPCLRCLPFSFPSLVQCYTPKPFQYHPVHAVVLLMHSMHGEEKNLSQVWVLTCFFGDKNKKATGVVFTSWGTAKKNKTQQRFVVDSVLQCTQNVLCFSTEGYEKPWSLNSMSGMSGDASGVSSVSALPCSPPCLMQHSHSPIPSIM